MVVHDEETLEEALLLVESGPVRLSDKYAYIIITDRNTLEARCRSSLGRGDIALVVPQGMELGMGDHPVELQRVRERRKREEKKAIRRYFQEHPEKVEKVEKSLKKKEETSSGKS